MATVATTFTLPGGVVVTKTTTISDADAPRILAMFSARYPAVEGIPSNPDFYIGKFIEETMVSLAQMVQANDAAVAQSLAVANLRPLGFSINVTQKT